MPQPFFRFKQFTVRHDRCAMKVTTDACLFGAWCAEVLRNEAPVDLLDIGTGTGLLPLMIAQQCPGRYEAVEIEPDAAAQAAENVAAAPFAAVEIVQGDVLRLPLRRYRTIVSNPPFYEHEPTPEHSQRLLAHHAGGLLWSDLFGFIRTHLLDSGSAFLLLPYKRRADLQRLLLENGLHVHARAIVHPTPGHEPARLLLRLGQAEAPLREEVICIKEGGQYSARFTELLRPYYLYL